MAQEARTRRAGLDERGRAKGDSLVSFDIAKSYPGFRLQCKADFTSGVTAIFGKSGSGKTTLLNCLSGIERPDAGRIEILGRRVYGSASPATYLPPERRRVGYLMQGGSLFPHMSVARNIAYGHELLRPERRTVSPGEVIDLLELTGLIDRPVAGLSGGEAQRVGLARALATCPDLLLLDEPLSALDAPMRGVIIRYLKMARAELGIPMVIVSHSLSEVLALADEALVLSGGRAVAQGPPAKVLVDPSVGALADYPDLENLLDGEIVRPADGSRPGRVRVGEAIVEAPEVRGRPGDEVTVSIGAADVIVATAMPTGLSARNVLGARLTELHPVKGRILAYCDVGVSIVVELTQDAVADLELREGRDVYLIVKTNSIRVLNPA